MKVDEAKLLVLDVIKSVLKNGKEVRLDMSLIGRDPLLDSMKLVEVCIALEDLADDRGFEFDWTSEAAMSKSRSIFKTIESLAVEFATQSGVTS